MRGDEGTGATQYIQKIILYFSDILAPMSIDYREQLVHLLCQFNVKIFPLLDTHYKLFDFYNTGFPIFKWLRNAQKYR